eukprot:COSAG06_NODE_41696_length_388_cov_2.719723_1_plen_118_part_10
MPTPKKIHFITRYIFRFYPILLSNHTNTLAYSYHVQAEASSQPHTPQSLVNQDHKADRSDEMAMVVAPIRAARARGRRRCPRAREGVRCGTVCCATNTLVSISIGGRGRCGRMRGCVV